VSRSSSALIAFDVDWSSRDEERGALRLSREVALDLGEQLGELVGQNSLARADLVVVLEDPLADDLDRVRRLV
jgi:hypothetical protein